MYLIFCKQRQTENEKHHDYITKIYITKENAKHHD